MKFSRHAKMLIGVAVSGLYMLTAYSLVSSQTGPNCEAQKSIWCIAPAVTMQLTALENATFPKLATPAWMEPAVSTPVRELTYSISSRGNETIDMSEFRSTVRETLADSRGWSRLGINFRLVDSGGEFVIFATESAQMASFDAVHCKGASSCTAGKAIAISQTSWQKLPTHLVKAKATIRSYQETLINHEVGHILGHGNRECTTDKALAPIMMSQMISLGKCSPNPWPTTEELYAPALGIRS